MSVKLLVILSLLGLIVSPVQTSAAHDDSLDHLRGWIVIQVEDHGEAWYVLPDSGERIYVKNGEAAYAALGNFGLGITNANLATIPVGLTDSVGEDDQPGDADQDGLPDKLEESLGTNLNSSDSDGDSYLDLVEVSNGYNPLGSGRSSVNQALTDSLRGKILLQVEARGQAWYVSPEDGKRYYMADGDSAYEIMRLKSLGITNWNLAHVPIYSGVLNCEESIDCMIGSIEAFTDFEGTVVSDAIILGQHVQAWSRLEYSATRGVDGRYPWTWTVENLIVDGVVQTDAIEAGENCRSVSYTDLIEILEDAKVGNYSTDASATVICEDFDSV